MASVRCWHPPERQYVPVASRQPAASASYASMSRRHEAPSMAGHTLVSFALELSVYARMCVHVRTFDRPQFCSEIVRCYHPFPGGGGYGGMGVGSAPQG